MSHDVERRRTVVLVAEDYCDLCDLPLSQCVHGMPKPAPVEPAPRQPAARKAPARVPGTRASTAPVAKSSAPRRWTSPEELRPFILTTLRDAGGELGPDDVFDALEETIGDRFRAGDREANPQGELRWRAAARKARKSLMDDGYLAEAGPGVWRLTDLGRQADVTP